MRFPFPLNTALLTKIEILLIHKLSTINDSQMERPTVGDRKLMAEEPSTTTSSDWWERSIEWNGMANTKYYRRILGKVCSILKESGRYWWGVVSKLTLEIAGNCMDSWQCTIQKLQR